MNFCKTSNKSDSVASVPKCIAGGLHELIGYAQLGPAPEHLVRLACVFMPTDRFDIALPHARSNQGIQNTLVKLSQPAVELQ